jgi:UDP-N-acetylglucosamine 3-dehydrogenase
MNKLKMAVVGVGFWGRNHVRVLSELPEVEIVAVCDVDREKAEMVSEKYSLKTYTDSRRMYRKEELDAVTLCVWSTMLSQETLKALKAGKHVLVEKPMAGSAKEAKRVLDLAEARNLHLTVGFIERFNPAVRHLKEAIEKGEIGSSVSATVKRVSKWPERIGDIGVVKDTAIHDLDIVRYIFDEDPVAVYARAGNLRHEAYEDYAQIMLTFSGGKSAFLEANWLTPYKIRKLTVTGSEAIISLDYITQEMTIETSGQTLTPRYEWEEPLKLELQHFVEFVLNNKEPLVSGLDGLKALKIAEAALKSAAKGCLVELTYRE